MRISGTEPSSVILSQKGNSFQSWKVMFQKCQKQDEAKRDGEINPQYLFRNHFSVLSYWPSLHIPSLCLIVRFRSISALPLPMYHCWWTSCPRGYLSGSNFMFYLLRPILFRTCRYFTGLCSSNIPRYFLEFAFYHYPCTTAGGQVVPEGTCRVVILCSTCWDQSFSELVVILPDYALRISLGTFSILPFTTFYQNFEQRNIYELKVKYSKRASAILFYFVAL